MSEATKPTGSVAATASQRRRSSGAFAALHEQKRGSMDEAARARRQSIQEQMPQSGFLGRMWNSWARGHDNSGPAPGAKKPSLSRSGAGTLG
ncbi:Pumilio domain-containing protein [Venturia nashicola]|uniref:Pumilio domain-containing protein n=1 Tax=Venturia nashicola TaxID=86259 RepID=A0A4Z1NJB6_9PEZI|nr:Pumilio domain-containing protein [Venturia nashicola]TLD20880.1 Pumilio domain-containing protein [Venturia nashicola]